MYSVNHFWKIKPPFFRKTNNYRSCHTRRPRKEALPNVYNCAFVESDWYTWWQENDLFQNKNDEQSRQKIFMCLPPPNVTGNLHIGHALTVSIEDTIARWRRMSGDQVFWIPGFDHAGIATQLVIERRLMHAKNVRRKDLTRDEFSRECEIWKREKVKEISDQLKKLGASLDWKRCYYTMDEKFSKAVFKAFEILHDQKLISRSRRLVNWSPYLQSTLSDVEIESLQINEPRDVRIPGRNKPVPVGWMYFVDYELVDCPDRNYLTVATTRPETIAVDEAVAVNPTDDRYANLIGRRVRNPLASSRLLPVIGDEKVDKNLGTGVLKVTPGHSWDDYEIGVRHNLRCDLNMFRDDGTCSSDACPVDELRDLDRFDARQTAVDMLRSRNLLREIRPHQTSIPVCGRTGDIVEALLKNQLFLSVKPMAEKLLSNLDQRKMKFFPPYHENLMRLWLNEPRDWCISRQLWWGHRIPVFHVTLTNKNGDDDGCPEFIVARNEREAMEKCFTKFGREINVKTIKQDDDVLDTWFSSSLVPLVVNGWPENDDNLTTSKLPGYPLALMETGHDILTFWVTRMALICTHLTGQVPFKEVLLHGIVRDSHGRKMSKSLGNVIDPMDLIEGKTLEDLQKRLDSSDFDEKEKQLAKEELVANFPKGIPQCGADALRFSLLMGDVKRNTFNIFIPEIESHLHFCNKIWQGYKYMKPLLSPSVESITSKDSSYFSNLGNVEQWILSRLTSLVENSRSGLTNYEFHVYTQSLFRFWLHELCDVYLEYTKSYVWKNEVEQLAHIARVFRTIADVYFRCLAPVMPFLAEQFYSVLPWTSENISVHQTNFPNLEEVNFRNVLFDDEMRIVQSIVNGVRSLKVEFGLPLKTSVNGVLVCDAATVAAVNNFLVLLQKSTNLNVQLKVKEEFSLEKFHSTNKSFVSTLITADVQLFLELQNAERKRAIERLEKQIATRTARIKDLESRARFSAFIQEQKKKKRESKIFDPSDSIQTLKKEIDRLENMVGSMKT